MKDDKDLKLLLEIWLSEEDHPESERLLKKLTEDEEFKKEFTEHLAIMGKTKAVTSTEQKFPLLQEMLSSESKDELEYQDQIIASLKKEQKSKKVLRFVYAIAALVTIAFLIPFLNKPVDTDVSETEKVEELELQETLAYISSQQDAKWANEDFNYRRGISLEEVHLLSGTARIDFDYGASLIISGGTKFEVRDAGEIFLEEGNINCEVNEFGKGFKILTADSEIVDLGTAFQVQAGDSTKVHVIDGEIEVKPIASNELKKFTEKQAIQIRKDGFASLVYAPDISKTVENFELKQEKEREKRLQKWRQNNQELNRDPDTLLHFVKSNRPVRRSRLDAKGNAVKSLHIFGCDNGRGRWNSNGSLEYNKKYDRTMVRLSSEDHQNLTLATWVKVDHLKAGESALTCFEVSGRWIRNVNPKNRGGKNFKAGAFHCLRWHVSGNGRLKLHIAYYGETHGPGSLDNSVYHSPKVLGNEVEGEWIFLAVSVDSKTRTVKHYVNGYLVSEEPFKRDHTFNLEFLEIGNLSHPNKDAVVPDFRLRGSIDETFVSKRVFTPEEILDYYNNSRPE